MSKIKQLSIIALVLLLLGGIGSILTFRIADKNMDISEETIVDQAFTSVEVESDNMRIDILPTKDQHATVELTGRTKKKKNISFDVKVKGETLTIRAKERDFRLFSFDFISSLNLRVLLPEKQYKSLEVNNNNGKINVEDIKAVDLAAKTNNGSISLTNTSSEKIWAIVDNGKVSLDHAEGDIESSTDNGEISVNTRDLDRNIELRTSNGQIHIRTEKEPENATFQVNVNNGKINILDKYSGNTVIGSGKYMIKLSTNNGQIDVSK